MDPALAAIDQRLESETRKRLSAEAALQDARDALEQRICERTAKLETANELLRLHIHQADRGLSEYQPQDRGKPPRHPHGQTRHPFSRGLGPLRGPSRADRVRQLGRLSADI